MKCYSYANRGITVAGNGLDSWKMPVVLTESLLTAPNATFVDKLVFADVEVVDDKIFLHAQKDQNDERALVFYSPSELLEYDEPDQVHYSADLDGATISYRKREDEYGGWGLFSQYQRMVLVFEPGGVACFKVKRIHTSKVGFWAAHFLGKPPVTTEILKHVEVRYDGDQVTIKTVLEQTREIASPASAEASAQAKPLLA